MITLKFDDKFRDLIKISDEEEVKALKKLLQVFFYRKKDRKFGILPTYSNLILLAGEYCFKVQPILRYLIMRFNAQGQGKYSARLMKLMHSVDSKGINYYFNKLNSESSYGRELYIRKLEAIMRRDEQKVHSIVLLIFSLCPKKERPMLPQTVGISAGEFDEMFGEE